MLCLLGVFSLFINLWFFSRLNQKQESQIMTQPELQQYSWTMIGDYSDFTFPQIISPANFLFCLSMQDLNFNNIIYNRFSTA